MSLRRLSFFCPLLTLVTAMTSLTSAPLFAGVNPPGYPAFSAADYQPAGLGPKEPDLDIEYPGAASNRGIPNGMAIVSVLIDSGGKATDSMVTGCTDLVFGKKLQEQVPVIVFQPAKFKGVPVPSRFNPFLIGVRDVSGRTPYVRM